VEYTRFIRSEIGVRRYNSGSRMGRNLYILAATLGALALVSIALSFTNVAQQPGSPGDASLWRMTSIALLCVALIVALLGVFSSLFDQAERRHSIDRQEKRRRRSE
jgi:membrane protein DedA with SNARE-associated domain